MKPKMDNQNRSKRSKMKTSTRGVIKGKAKELSQIGKKWIQHTYVDLQSNEEFFMIYWSKDKDKGIPLERHNK